MASEVLLDPFDSKPWSPLKTNNGGKKTWEELRKSVRDTMKIFTNLASSVPSSFTFRTVPPSSSNKPNRLYFLGIPNKGRENTLLYADIKDDEHDKFVLPWKPLMESVQPAIINGQLSKEEQLMRERKRLGSYGITSYDFSEREGRFVFPANSNLYLLEDTDRTAECREPILIKSQCGSAQMDPKFCPSLPDIVAFISRGDIWVTHVYSLEELQLTHTQQDVSRGLADNPISAGTPSFVVQEEFDRYTGYWWQPVVDPKPGNGKPVLRILYEEVDESDVEILPIFAPRANSEPGGVDEYRYPRAGTPNARSTLKIVEFQVDIFGQMVMGPDKSSIIHRHLVEPLTSYCPWAEYLVRAGWTPDGKYAYAQLMDRSQRRLCLLLIPLDCFIPVVEDDIEMHCFDRFKYPSVQCIYEDTSDIWVNVHDTLHFFPQVNENEISFLWSSQKSGFRHLYHVTSSLADLSEEMEVEERSGECVQCQILREVQLTSGEWEIIGKQIWMDESKGRVFFIATKETPLETHLYAVSYLNPSEPVQLTESGYSHSVTLNSDCSMFVTNFSSIDTPSQTVVSKIEESEQGFLSSSTCCILMEPPLCPVYPAPELFHFNSTSGHILHGMFYRPHNYRPAVRYPTILFVYGGPQVQLVTNSFKGLKFLRLHTLASQGYAVVMLDGRGSCNRGLRFESYIKGNLGSVELEDQIEGLYWLASGTDFIDLSRVAIHGWSYGGYLSLMGLAQRPDVFKVAIAGAPVVSWSLYDTGYTERYMSLPDFNTEGYKKGSVLYYLDNFPDEENRLLIVHGLIDENVHFHHTTQLVSALVRTCKPHRLQVYPNERHGIRSHESNEHYKTLVLSFLQDNL